MSIPLPDSGDLRHGPQRHGIVTHMPRDLGELYRAAADGDSGAFDELYALLKNLVWWTIRNTGITGADAEDIFQATWATFLEHLGRHQKPSAVKSWLVAVARNRCIDLGRVSGRTVPVDELLDIEADNYPPDELAIHALDVAALDAVLSGLNERDRQLVALWANGVSYKEIHIALGIPAGSVGPTIARCRQKLAELMKERK